MRSRIGGADEPKCARIGCVEFVADEVRNGFERMIYRYYGQSAEKLSGAPDELVSMPPRDSRAGHEIQEFSRRTQRLEETEPLSGSRPRRFWCQRICVVLTVSKVSGRLPWLVAPHLQSRKSDCALGR